MKLKTAILTIAAAVFAVSSVAAAEWTVQDSTDVMTDKASYYATSAWTKPNKPLGIPYSDTEAILGIGCESGDQWVYVKSNKLPVLNDGNIGDGYYSYNVRVRFDDHPPTKVEVIQKSGSDSLQFSGSYENIVSQKFGKHESMLLELDVRGQGLSHFSFDLAGAGDAISEVYEKCRFVVKLGGALHDAVWEGNAALVKELLAAGADPNATDNRGDTALLVAAKDGEVEIVKLLLAAGANPNARDNRGDTALIRVERHVKWLKDQDRQSEDPAIAEIADILRNYTPGQYDHLLAAEVED